MSAFPNYTQMPRRLPLRAWRAIRVASVAAAAALVVVLLAEPDAGLFALWDVAVPLLPLVFFLAPGLWRNLCPLAASNQTPRVLGFSRAARAPAWLAEYGYVIAIAAFTLAVINRKALFNDSGAATAALLALALGAAFTGGVLLKGKSGWCSSVCPLLPVQRIYGQTPFAVLPNSHCQPCVGCTKNCYDFNPHVAYLADLHDSDSYFSGYRKLFVGAFPGIVLAYFTVPDPPAIGVAELYGRFALYIAASAGSFALLSGFVKTSAVKLTTLYGAAALNIFYWYAAPSLIEAVTAVDEAPAWAVWPARAALLAVTVLWLLRTYRKERVFEEQAAAPPAVTLGAGASAAHERRAAQGDGPEVCFTQDGARVVAAQGATLLEVAERDGRQIESGCRMGICGADPVAVVEGMENLSPVGDDERATLERLGLAENTRMACCARLSGPVSVSLEPERPAQRRSSSILGFAYDRDVERVVVVGNGIAGVTAADHVRRRHPLCAIDLVAEEPYHLYNRMGITRLVYGRSAMKGLMLLPDSWYDENVVTPWLNTQAAGLDLAAKEVRLAVGDALRYDRLILAAGSSAHVPPIEGFGLPGTFVLRSAADAVHMRDYAQRHRCRSAVIAGGGLLGLEAAYALHKLGLDVTVLERSQRVLARQLDARGSELLRAYLEGLGLDVLLGVEAAEVLDEGIARRHGGVHHLVPVQQPAEMRARRVVLRDGRTLPADMFLVSAGIRPNVRLAQEAGLEVARGVVVDERMRTSDPDVYAAGDVAQFGGEVLGLWPAAVEQAQVAAVNAVGGDSRYAGTIPVTVLKVVGVDLTSVGRLEPRSDAGEVIALEEPEEKRYRKLVIEDGRITGAILLGYSTEAAPVTTAVKRGLPVTAHLDALRAGEWQVLERLDDRPLSGVAPALS